MKSENTYNLLFKDYPDVVNATQMCEMLGNISIKTGYPYFTNYYPKIRLCDITAKHIQDYYTLNEQI